MKKRILSMCTALCIMCSLTIPAVAAESSPLSESQIQAEVNAIVEDRVNAVADQFKGLPDSYLRVYKQIASAQAEAYVLEKHGLSSIDSSNLTPKSYSFIFNNGGVVHYRVTDELSGSTFAVAVACLDRQRTLDFILNAGSSFSMADILLDIFGYLPIAGNVFSLLASALSYANASTLSKINAAGGYAQITNIAIMVGNEPSSMATSTVEGWTSHPYYAPPSHATQVSSEFFPAYNG